MAEVILAVIFGVVVLVSIVLLVLHEINSSNWRNK